MTQLNTLMAFGFGQQEIIIIAIIALVLFGGSKLPELARGFGQSVKEFRKINEEASDIDLGLNTNQKTIRRK